MSHDLSPSAPWPNNQSAAPLCFQYLLKVNEIKVKKGVDFLQNLIKYFHAQCKYAPVSLSRSAPVHLSPQTDGGAVLSFFQDGLKTVESVRPSVEKLASDLTAVRLLNDSALMQRFNEMMA